MRPTERHPGLPAVRTCLGLAVLAVGLAAETTSAQVPLIRVSEVGGQTQVPRWQPCDFAFVSAAQPANPFTLAFSAVIKGPAGQQLKTAGFYDGQGTWKIRVSPTAEGTWSLMTQSEAPDLNAKTVQFRCVSNPNPEVHGALRIDAEHPHHFVFEDGTRYFLMGYECDWLWALDLGRPDLKITDAFLDKLITHGFNYILLNAYAHDTSWRAGKTGEDDFGPPPMFAWEGSNEKPDFSRFNTAYWQHYDKVIDALLRRGIVAHIMIKVYNKKVNWPAKGSPEDDQFFRWMMARYAAYPNVHWDFSKEAYNEKDLDYKLGRVRFIRQNDPYHRLITVHDDHEYVDAGDYNDLQDYRSDQIHSKWYQTERDHLQQRAWPVVNVEFGYEHGPEGINDKTYGVAQASEEVCRRAWEICMAGGYGAYYYTYTAWDVIRPQHTPPGYAYFKSLRSFFEDTGYWRMEPAPGLVSEGHCLAEPGSEYVVFLNKAQPFSLRLEGCPSPLQGQWYQPLTGKRQDAGTLSKGAAQLTPPPDWGTGPVALHVGTPGR